MTTTGIASSTRRALKPHPHATTDPPPVRPSYKWAVIGMLWFICLFNYADRMAISSALPILEQDFGFNKEQLGLISSAFMWSYALSAPLAGQVADRASRKLLPVGVVRLDGRGLMLVFNNDPKKENNLTLAVSADGGSTWTNLAILDETQPGERGGLTYPSLTRSSEGTYHLVYAQPGTRAIQHIRFNDAWVHSLQDEARPPKAGDGF
jgi:hypothetical protein